MNIYNALLILVQAHKNVSKQLVTVSKLIYLSIFDTHAQRHMLTDTLAGSTWDSLIQLRRYSVSFHDFSESETA